jgi:hypothetical protein
LTLLHEPDRNGRLAVEERQRARQDCAGKAALPRTPKPGLPHPDYPDDTPEREPLARPATGWRQRWRAIAPAIGLFFLSPLVAEYLLGNIAIDALAGLVVLAPL